MAAVRGEVAREGPAWARWQLGSGKAVATVAVVGKVRAAMEGAAVKESVEAAEGKVEAAMAAAMGPEVIVEALMSGGGAVEMAVVKAARAEAARAEMASAAEETVWAWMEEAVMGVEAIESRAVVVLVAAAVEQGATVKEGAATMAALVAAVRVVAK